MQVIIEPTESNFWTSWICKRTYYGYFALENLRRKKITNCQKFMQYMEYTQRLSIFVPTTYILNYLSFNRIPYYSSTKLQAHSDLKISAYTTIQSSLLQMYWGHALMGKKYMFLCFHLFNFWCNLNDCFGFVCFIVSMGGSGAIVRAQFIWGLDLISIITFL